MHETLDQEFQVNQDNVSLSGWRFKSEASCAAYLSNRVKARIEQSDSSFRQRVARMGTGAFVQIA